MACYKSGGCGIYEGLSCNECPASKPTYNQRNDSKLRDEYKKIHNEFFDLIDSPMLKMDNVIRYSGTYQLSQELLSTHVVDVQIISLIIARNLISRGEMIDIGILLQKGLIHDVDEVLVGDIPRLTKYSSPECHDALNKVAESVMKDISNKLDGTDFVYNLWTTAKDKTPEGYILKLADMISVAKKVSQEVEILNNNNFLRIAVEMMNYIHDLINSVPVDLFYTPAGINYIKNLLMSIEEYLSSIVKNRQDVIEKFNIENTAVKFIINNRYKE